MDGIPSIRTLVSQSPSQLDIAMAQDVGLQTTAAYLVTQVYHQILNREPDPAGLAYWTNEVRSGHLSHAEFEHVFIAGIQP